MGEEKLDETDEGYYVQAGDVREWHWKPGHEPKVYGAVMVVAETPMPEPEPEPVKKTATKKAK